MDEDLFDWLGEGANEEHWSRKTWLFLSGLVCMAAGLFAPVPVWGLALLLILGGGLVGVWVYCLLRERPDFNGVSEDEDERGS